MQKKAWHPDFTTSQTLNPRQRSWCSRNGIKVTPDQIAGFYFSKGDRWIDPVYASTKKVLLLEQDASGAGDGARCVASFSRLRDALAVLKTS